MGDWSAESGYRVGQQLLADGDLPTAVFAANDLMAIGLIRALVEAGVSVPGQVSVVGFDDIDATGFMLPPLTTVRQDLVTLGRLGRRAAAGPDHRSRAVRSRTPAARAGGAGQHGGAV